MTDKEAELENERVALDAMLKSEGWKLYYSKWAKLHKECVIQLADRNTHEREWLAGLVTGYERMLTWPASRVNDVDKTLRRVA